MVLAKELHLCSRSKLRFQKLVDNSKLVNTVMDGGISVSTNGGKGRGGIGKTKGRLKPGGFGGQNHELEQKT